MNGSRKKISDAVCRRKELPSVTQWLSGLSLQMNTDSSCHFHDCIDPNSGEGLVIPEASAMEVEENCVDKVKDRQDPHQLVYIICVKESKQEMYIMEMQRLGVNTGVNVLNSNSQDIDLYGPAYFGSYRGVLSVHMFNGTCLSWSLHSRQPPISNLMAPPLDGTQKNEDGRVEHCEKILLSAATPHACGESYQRTCTEKLTALLPDAVVLAYRVDEEAGDQDALFKTEVGDALGCVFQDQGANPYTIGQRISRAHFGDRWSNMWPQWNVRKRGETLSWFSPSERIRVPSEFSVFCPRLGKDTQLSYQETYIKAVQLMRSWAGNQRAHDHGGKRFFLGVSFPQYRQRNGNGIIVDIQESNASVGVDGYLVTSGKKALVWLNSTLTDADKERGKAALLKRLQSSREPGVFYWEVTDRDEPDARLTAKSEGEVVSPEIGSSAD